MSKEFRFFAYLLESYAAHKGLTASEVLQLLDEKGPTDFVYSMYELYHVEAYCHRQAGVVKKINFQAGMIPRFFVFICNVYYGVNCKNNQNISRNL